MCNVCPKTPDTLVQGQPGETPVRLCAEHADTARFPRTTCDGCRYLLMVGGFEIQEKVWEWGPAVQLCSRCKPLVSEHCRSCSSPVALGTGVARRLLRNAVDLRVGARCADCAPTLITSPPQARPLYDEAVRWLARWLHERNHNYPTYAAGGGDRLAWQLGDLTDLGIGKGMRDDGRIGITRTAAPRPTPTLTPTPAPIPKPTPVLPTPRVPELVPTTSVPSSSKPSLPSRQPPTTPTTSTTSGPPLRPPPPKPGTSSLPPTTTTTTMPTTTTTTTTTVPTTTTTTTTTTVPTTTTPQSTTATPAATDQGTHVVTIMGSLSSMQFRATMIHELTHAWTRELGHGYGGDIEGFCEYVATQYLGQVVSGVVPATETEKATAARILERMLNSDDPHYGVGLRRVRDRLGTTGDPVAWLRQNCRARP